MDPKQVIEIDYTNWKGERSLRRILPLRLLWESSEWHPETQWFVHATDVDKNVERSFAVKSIHSWKAFTPKDPADNEWLLHCRHGQTCFRHGACMYRCPLMGHPKLSDWMAEEGALALSPFT